MMKTPLLTTEFNRRTLLQSGCKVIPTLAAVGLCLAGTTHSGPRRKQLRLRGQLRWNLQGGLHRRVQRRLRHVLRLRLRRWLQRYLLWRLPR